MASIFVTYLAGEGASYAILAVSTMSKGIGRSISFDFGILTRDWGFPLEKIQTPISMWYGAKDDLAPVALACYMAEHIPDCKIKIAPGAGHAATFACADEVISTLIQ